MRVMGSAVGMQWIGTAGHGALCRELLARFVHMSLARDDHQRAIQRGDQALMSHAREQRGEYTAHGDGAGRGVHQHASMSDDPAFDTFFRRHEQPLYGYLRRLLPSDDAAMDVAQEAFFRAWKHFEQIHAYERPEAWLYRVATNLALSQLRRRKPLSFTQAFHRAGAETGSGDGGEDESVADPLDMEDELATRDLINRALLRLPERQRAALLLHIVQGFSCEEVAEMLDTSAANVRQMLARGRARFRLLYSEAVDEHGQIG